MTAYERYRPTVDLALDAPRPAVDCAECRDSEGWAGVRVWTAPENAAVDVAGQLRAIDKHELAHHAGCQCPPYDCTCDDEEI